MKKRNLVAMGLAGIMAVGMCMPVMAENVTVPGDTSVPVSMSVTEAYEVAIPASITVNSTDTKVAVEFSVTETPLVEVGKSVNVKIANPEIKLSTGTEPNTAEYKMYFSTDGSSAASANAVLVDFDGTNGANDKKSTSLITTDASKLTNSGEYTANAVFTIAVE